MPPQLEGHPRLWNTCLLLLQQKGYTLWCTPDPTDEMFQSVTWWAEKDEDSMEFHAENPLELLGLVVLYEDTGPAVDLVGPNLLGQIFSSAFPDLILMEEGDEPEATEGEDGDEDGDGA